MCSSMIDLYVSFAKEPYKRDNILQMRPIIVSILLTVATPCHVLECTMCSSMINACRIMNACRVMSHVWMSHVTSPDTIECTMCSSMINAYRIMNACWVMSHMWMGHVTTHNTNECTMCSSMMNVYRIMNACRVMSHMWVSHVSHVSTSYHNTRHHNVLIYGEFGFFHPWWVCVEICSTCGWVMSLHTPRMSVQCAHLWWIHLYDECMSSHVSHVHDSCHNTRHDWVYNVLIYDEFIFSHLWWMHVESCLKCRWVMSQHTIKSSV